MGHLPSCCWGVVLNALWHKMPTVAPESRGPGMVGTWEAEGGHPQRSRVTLARGWPVPAGGHRLHRYFVLRVLVPLSACGLSKELGLKGLRGLGQGDSGRRELPFVTSLTKMAFNWHFPNWACGSGAPPAMREAPAWHGGLAAFLVCPAGDSPCGQAPCWPLSRIPWHFLLALLPSPGALFQQTAGPWHREVGCLRGPRSFPQLFLPLGVAGPGGSMDQFCLMWK